MEVAIKKLDYAFMPDIRTASYIVLENLAGCEVAVNEKNVDHSALAV